MSPLHSGLPFAALLCIGCVASVDDAHLSPMANNDDLRTTEAVHSECPPGADQSPVDLPIATSSTAQPALIVDYHETRVSISNTGKTVQYSHEPGSYLSVAGTRYELVQFHFHAHSEHSVGGVLMPMEIHLVHRDSVGQLLVVGVLVAQGPHNSTFDAAHWSLLPSATGDVVDLPSVVFNAQQLLPGGPTYRYVGSLTAPPCTGDVSWIVFQRQLTMDATQIETFTRLYSHNVRELQPLGDRHLEFGE